jgi:hypothetical protein
MAFLLPFLPILYVLFGRSRQYTIPSTGYIYINKQKTWYPHTHRRYLHRFHCRACIKTTFFFSVLYRVSCFDNVKEREQISIKKKKKKKK